MMAYNKLKFIMNSRTTSTNLKLRTFNSFITSIFLYNCELWTMDKKAEHKIDVFQRSLLRRMMKLSWQDKVTNEELYQRTNQTRWSNVIRTRRMAWFGHLLRLPEKTPAKMSLAEIGRRVKRPQGRPKQTWIRMIQKQLQELNIDYTNAENLAELASDRYTWHLLTDK